MVKVREAGRRLVKRVQRFLCKKFLNTSPKPILLQAQGWHISGIKEMDICLEYTERYLKGYTFNFY